jgi:RimJ/RimL family protein N-acetyltransferase
MRKVHVELCADEIQLLEIHRKLGFCEEGRLVRHIVKSDKAWDVILLAHFKESWEKKRKNLESLVTDGGSFQ